MPGAARTARVHTTATFPALGCREPEQESVMADTPREAALAQRFYNRPKQVGRVLARAGNSTRPACNAASTISSTMAISSE